MTTLRWDRRVADELSQQYPGEVFVYHRERKEGLGRAYVAAFQHVLKNFNYASSSRWIAIFPTTPFISGLLEGDPGRDLVLVRGTSRASTW